MPTAIKAPASWLSDGAVRLDASFYAGEGQKQAREFVFGPLRKALLQTLCIDGVGGIFYPGRGARLYVNGIERGMPFVSSSGIMLADPLERCKYVSRRLARHLEDQIISEGMTLVSRSGTVGNTVYAGRNLAGAAVSEHAIRIVPDPDRIPPGFVYAFLSSKIGKALITQHIYGSVIQHIEPHHLYNLPVPILPERAMNEAHDMVTRAADLMTKANQTLRDLVETIEQQYSPPATNSKRALAFAVSSKRLFEADKYTDEKRLEADFYLPDTSDLISHLESLEDCNLIGDMTERIYTSGLRQRCFVSKGVPLFTGQNLEMSRPDYSKQLSRTLTQNVTQNISEDGDILISAHGTIGKIQLCHKNFYQGVFPDQHIISVRLKKQRLHPGYLYCFLRSRLGQQQLLKYKTGSVIEWIRGNHIASIRMPVPKDKGALIGRKAYSACDQRQKAFDLEQEAIALVERTIETQM